MDQEATKTGFTMLLVCCGSQWVIAALIGAWIQRRITNRGLAMAFVPEFITRWIDQVRND